MSGKILLSVRLVFILALDLLESFTLCLFYNIFVVKFFGAPVLSFLQVCLFYFGFDIFASNKMKADYNKMQFEENPTKLCIELFVRRVIGLITLSVLVVIGKVSGAI